MRHEMMNDGDGVGFAVFVGEVFVCKQRISFATIDFIVETQEENPEMVFRGDVGEIGSG